MDEQRRESGRIRVCARDITVDVRALADRLYVKISYVVLSSKSSHDHVPLQRLQETRNKIRYGQWILYKPPE